jgi:RHS repeat-associated protein
VTFSTAKLSALVALISACTLSGTDKTAHILATTTDATFMHAGFAAGPAVFTDASGDIIEERRYEPYGTPLDAVDVVALDLNALNKRTDASTGWSDHGARWLAPETGRWLSTDPPVAAPSSGFMAAPWKLHPYQYVSQNPISYWDPDGNDGEVIGFGAAAVLDLTASVASRVNRVPVVGTAGAVVVGAVGLTVAAMVYNRQHYAGRPLIGALPDQWSSDLLEDRFQAEMAAYDRERAAYLHLQMVIAMVESHGHAATAAAVQASADRDSKKGGPFVYRALALGEDVSFGIVARSPGIGNSPASHINGARESQWISFTKTGGSVLEVRRSIERMGQGRPVEG